MICMGAVAVMCMGAVAVICMGARAAHSASAPSPRAEDQDYRARTVPSEPGTVVESANRLQILQVQFPTHLYGSPHTIDWATPDRACIVRWRNR